MVLMSARRAQRVEVVGDLPGETGEALLVVEGLPVVVVEGLPAVAAAQRLQLSSSRIAPR